MRARLLALASFVCLALATGPAALAGTPGDPPTVGITPPVDVGGMNDYRLGGVGIKPRKPGQGRLTLVDAGGVSADAPRERRGVGAAGVTTRDGAVSTTPLLLS
ncbi:hypothetical protein OIE66_42730 [Nonomuraea sp. NBC_01738]|uniref:hypothetical protein n=1 Tax=Nonomuraea sp. NBC_01738 TaxID=2976003 RepID=UPI002E10049D|nr:hypothetical protein OIE66_42730 [Nonomuraea sp. NBC_01738]